MRVVVLTCGDLGVEVGSRLRALPSVERVLVLHAPFLRRRPTGLKRWRHLYRMNGPWDLAKAIVTKPFRRRAVAPPAAALEAPADVELEFVAGFHTSECDARLRAFAPDLGVIAGTYILKPQIFELPRLGSINLHSGKTPEYRGAAPAFWELYNGESEVGITIHQVVADVDAGAVYRQETFPLERAPAGDPMTYLKEYRTTILRPNGVRMLVETVADIAAGRAAPVSQDQRAARVYHSPTYADVRELRRRVAARRKGRSP